MDKEDRNSPCSRRAEEATAWNQSALKESKQTTDSAGAETSHNCKREDKENSATSSSAPLEGFLIVSKALCQSEGEQKRALTPDLLDLASKSSREDSEGESVIVLTDPDDGSFEKLSISEVMADEEDSKKKPNSKDNDPSSKDDSDIEMVDLDLETEQQDPDPDSDTEWEKTIDRLNELSKQEEEIKGYGDEGGGGAGSFTPEQKQRFTTDLMAIMDLDEPTASEALVRFNYDVQAAIDHFFELQNQEAEEDPENERPVSNDSPVEEANTGETSGASTSSGAKQKRRRSTTEEPSVPNVMDEETGRGRELVKPGRRIVPEKISIICWNIDSLEERNWERRCDYVISLIERENHDIVFLQELVVRTFERIGTRLKNRYSVLPGTDDPNAQYFTAILLKSATIRDVEDYRIDYPTTRMGRNLHITKAIIGNTNLALMNTHLESMAEHSGERREQLRICFDMATTFDPSYNVIFGGDLNIRDKEVPNPCLMADLWQTLGARETARYTFDLRINHNKQMPGKVQPRCRFDRLYFRPAQNGPSITPEFFGITGIELVPHTQMYASDHWAILAFFKVPQIPFEQPPANNACIDGNGNGSEREHGHHSGRVD